MIWKPSLVARRPIADSESKGIVLDLPMIEGGGNMVHDYSGNGNDGLFVGDTHFDRGSVRFDGTGDYINTLMGTLQVFTFVVSINTHISGIIQNIIGPSGSGGPLLRIEANGTIGLLKAGQVFLGASTKDILIGQFTYVAASYDVFGNYEFYIDGRPSGSGTNLTTFTPRLFKIGIRSTSSEPFNGLIQDAKIYNRALTAGEVQQQVRDSYLRFRRDPIELWSAATQGAAATGIPIFRRRMECA